MTNCDFGLAMLLSAIAAGLVVFIFGSSAISLMRMSYNKLIGVSFPKFNPFRLIPIPIYKCAMFAGLVFLVYANMPTKEQRIPCGPEGQAMIQSAINIAKALPIPYVSEAAAKPLEDCGCSDKK